MIPHSKSQGFAVVGGRLIHVVSMANKWCHQKETILSTKSARSGECCGGDTRAEKSSDRRRDCIDEDINTFYGKNYVTARQRSLGTGLGFGYAHGGLHFMERLVYLVLAVAVLTLPAAVNPGPGAVPGCPEDGRLRRGGPVQPGRLSQGKGECRVVEHQGRENHRHLPSGCLRSSRSG